MRELKKQEKDRKRNEKLEAQALAQSKSSPTGNKEDERSSAANMDTILNDNNSMIPIKRPRGRPRKIVQVNEQKNQQGIKSDQAEK